MFSNKTINFQNHKFLSFQTDGISVCGLHVQPRVDGAFVHDVSIASARLRTVTLRCWMTVYAREKPQNVSKYALMKVRVQNGSLMNGIRWNSLIFKCITNILLLIKKWKILLFHQHNLLFFYPTHAQCSKSCGDGVQTRKVECMSMEDNSVESRRCSEEDKPNSVRTCFNAPCGSTWKTTNWGEVSCHRNIKTFARLFKP